MSEHKSFEFKVNDITYELIIGQCAVALFYKNPEVDYIAINHTNVEEDTVRVFNANLARWAGGFAPVWDDEEGEWYYPTTYWDVDGEELTFRQAVDNDDGGWSPATILKNEPFDWEMDKYVYLQTRGVDGEISDFLGGWE